MPALSRRTSRPAYRNSLSRIASARSVWGLLLACCLLPATPAAAWQNEAETGNTLKATLVEITSRGRTHTVVVETDGGEKQQFKVTPKVDFSVTAPAKGDLLKPGQFIFVEGFVTNDRFFGKQYSVLVQHQGRLPRPAITKAPKKAGRSTNAYFITGEIVSRQQDEAYPDFETLTLKVGGKNGTNVYLDKGFTVTASSNNPELAEAGAEVEITGKPGRGGRVDVTSIEVRRKAPFPAEEGDSE